MRLELANAYIGDELARNAVAALPNDYEVEFPSERQGRNDYSSTDIPSLGKSGILIVLDALRDNLREWNLDPNISSFNVRPLYDLVEITAIDDNGNPEGRISAKVFEFETGFFAIPLTFPANERVIGILKYLSLDERVGFLTELVRIFRNLVRFIGNGQSVYGDIVRLLGQFVGLLSLAVSEYCDHDAECSCDCSDDSPVHVESVSGAFGEVDCS